ncbi:beta-glucosidase [Myceligenerans pegani]|uniref:Glycoside hydrolase family 3 C-terminal domain-containing protein n=1 Tax=Myceligenerans pegani TaxID=2776917 RepID=A0ABR9N3P3_9MICO|nr:glycoside hydrolase family 3 N-terminal domain-containing protein [Myceligenerans sp. TRM 65318]MBE1878284.1 glycoside hydrolase family 3 C-terminal domain-containing protein [Myceligenerans sp. TRM 65318]MBE3020555.1 glycoside hydrolase family 3 C-terminal domain-containing protein [Myceligenerans sp. TRM 65318]
MERSEYRQLVRRHTADARQRHADLRARRRERRATLSRPERAAARRADAREIKDWKAEIRAVESRRERRARKKGYKAFRRREHRWMKLTAAGAVVALLVAPFGLWYHTATRPETPAQAGTRAHSLQVADQVMAEGMVLLENEEDTLPFAERAVSVFGVGAVTPVYGGGGAGGISPVGARSLFAALDAEGIDYDETVRDVYGNYAESGEVSTEPYREPGPDVLDTLLPAVKGFLAASPREMPVADLPRDVLTRAREHSDTAVYVLSRAGMEGMDLSPEDLRPTAEERATLELLAATFEHVVVLINSANAMELGILDELENVDAALWLGGPGEIGMDAVARALTGRVNPSGRLTDTYAYDVRSHPAVANTGDFEYVDAAGSPTGRYFTNHLEGIYVGYRYFETFVEDDRYDDVVQYPFGHGLSYTDFEWRVEAIEADTAEVSARVTVANTGDVPGKDVVQVYYDAPYTPGGIEKSATVLGGYAKTGELAPGESETVSVTFDTSDMASYDDQEHRAWVLEAGDYEIRVARHVHDTVRSATYTQRDTVVHRTDPVTGTRVTNRFDDARGDLTYLSRQDPERTMPQAPAADDLLLPDGLLEADFEHVAAPSAVAPTTGADRGIVLEDLEGKAIDDPLWDDFLDQLTEEELVRLAGNGGYWSSGIDRLGVPRTTMYDGPASIRSYLGHWATVAFPTPVVLAATWNDALAREVGGAMGAEAQAYEVDAVYAPSLDLHRTPLGGRNFEYFSEDPLLTARIGARYVAGLQSEGTIAVIKHFAGNVQETNRAAMGLYVWTTEQAWRELHLEPFEAAVKDGGAHGAMTAFNRIGTTWTGGSSALLTDILRSEWGFEGFVITDAGVAGQGGHFDALQAARSGNDLMLGLLVDLPGDGAYEQELKAYLDEDRAGTLTALREAAHHILYYVTLTNRI